MSVRSAPIAVFLLLHVPLAILMKNATLVATLHAILCAIVGIAVAATTHRRARTMYAIAYLAGGEVLWRMNHAAVFWELGKYATIAICAIAIARDHVRKNRRLAIAYILFLVPSVALTFASVELDRARQDIAYNLAGPVAIAAAAAFGSGLRFTPRQLVTAFVAYLGPVVGIGGLALYSTISHAKLEFIDAANYTTSAGFGPNEVSGALGFGAMLALFAVMDRQVPRQLRLLLLGLALALLTLAALTFARGGLVLAVIGALVAMLGILRRNRRGRAGVVFVAVLTLVIGRYVIEPRLEQMTAGELSERYTTLKTSGRVDLVESELALFADHPVLGVGPGMGWELRTDSGWPIASHTEYSRMLAEHGIFGIFSLVCLVILGVRAIRQARGTQARAIAAALVVWFALFLLIYATRVVAPAFAFGLAFAVTPPTTKPTAPRASPRPELA